MKAEREMRNDDCPKRETMSIEEATVFNMWEIAAMAESPQDYPPSEVLPSGLSPDAPCRYSSHRADVHRLNCKEASS